MQSWLESPLISYRGLPRSETSPQLESMGVWAMQQVEVGFLRQGSVREGRRFDGDSGWGRRAASMVVRNTNAWTFVKSFSAPVSSMECLLGETMCWTHGL